MEQINMLHDTNSKICRNLHETKGLLIVVSSAALGYVFTTVHLKWLIDIYSLDFSNLKTGLVTQIFRIFELTCYNLLI